jgi:hypothetical protein
MKTTLELLKAEGYEPIKMPKTIKNKWLNALRSGEYDQATGALYDDNIDGDGNPGFCCLGVLQHCLTGGVEFDGGISGAVPSDEWLDEFNIKTNDFQVFYKDDVQTLADLNDCEGLTFKQIANIIEKQVVGV